MSRLIQRDPAGNMNLNVGEILHTVTSKSAFSVSVDGRHIVRQARGLVFLTSQRVILCSEKPSTDRNFFFPIVMITNAHYEQPFFSANNFHADCDILPDGSLVGNKAHFKIIFDCGGGHEYAAAWSTLSASIHVRRAPAAPPSYEHATAQTPLDVSVAAAMQGPPMYHAASRPGAAFASADDKPPEYAAFAKKSD